MFLYTIKRLLLFIPSFFLVSLLVFGLSRLVEGDPVDMVLNKGGEESPFASAQAYRQKARELGLDRPAFYFRLSSQAYPKDLYQLQPQQHRTLLSRLMDQYGAAEHCMAYYRQLKNWEQLYYEQKAAFSYEEKGQLDQLKEELWQRYEERPLDILLDSLAAKTAKVAPLALGLDSVRRALHQLRREARPYETLIPQLYFYGLNNQYHVWMFGDYPYFSAPDSSVHHRLDSCYAQLGRLNLAQDSLARLGRRLAFQLEQLDSLEQAPLLAQIEQLEQQQEQFNKSYRQLAAERDRLLPLREVYASRGLIRGDLGISYQDQQPVLLKIWAALRWTLLMNLLAILISYGVSVPLGVEMASWRYRPRAYYSFLSPLQLIFGALLALCFFLQLMELVSGVLWAVIPLQLVFMGLNYRVFLKQWGRSFGPEIRRFAKALLRGRMLDISEYSLLFLQIVYLWFWVLLFLSWGLQPLWLKLGFLILPFFFFLGPWRGQWRLSKQKGLELVGDQRDKLSSNFLFLLYSLPSFWLASLLVVFLTTATYGAHYDWFPTQGLPNSQAFSWGLVGNYLYHLFLPIFAISYGSFAYLSRQMRSAMLQVLAQDYIRTARAKGLRRQEVYWGHAFRNALFPLITLFSAVFPRALAGAIAIELIFDINGMGLLVIEAIRAYDWPLVFGVTLMAALLTILGNLVADLLYAWVDPRVKY